MEWNFKFYIGDLRKHNFVFNIFSHVEYIDQCKQLIVTAVLNLSSATSSCVIRGKLPIFLSLNFLTCEIGIMVLMSQGFYGKYCVKYLLHGRPS